MMVLATGLYLLGVFLFIMVTPATAGVAGQSLAYVPISAAMLVLIHLGLTKRPGNFVQQWYVNSPTIAPGLLFLAGLIISLPNARNLGLAGKDCLRWAFVWLAFAPATRAVCYDEKQCRLVVRLVAGLILVASVLAVGDLVFGGRVMGRLIAHAAVSAQGRYGSIYEQAGIFAGMLNVAFPLALVAALTSARWWGKGVWAAGTLAMLAAMLLTGARSTVAAVLAASLIVFPARRQWWVVIALIVFLGGLLAFANSPTIRSVPTLSRLGDISRGGGTGTRSLHRRMLIWSVALDLIQKHPLFGFGGSQLRYLQHAGFNRAHNAWLDAWIDGGLLAALAMVMIAVLVLRRAWQTLFGPIARYRHPTHIAVLAASCAVLVGWLVRAGIGSRIDWLPIFLLFSLSWDRTANGSKQLAPRSRVRTRSVLRTEGDARYAETGGE